MDLKLKGKKALITGSSAGIGEMIAMRLAEEGAIVMLHGRSENELIRIQNTIQKNGGQAFYAVGNLESEKEASHIAQATLSKLQGIDILINNAGLYYDRGWNNTNGDDWLNIYSVNVVSAVRLIHYFLPHMMENRWGRIIQIASITAEVPSEVVADYSASKAAMVNMSVSLAKHCKDSGVTVNTVSPGPIATTRARGFFSKIAKDKNWGTDWESIERHVANELFSTPLGRMGRPEEVGDLVAFLASPLSGFITGSNIRIDGGTAGVV